MYQEITPHELEKLLKKSSSPILLDVREEFELKISNFQNSTHIPMNEIPDKINNLDPKKSYVVICKSGIRSAYVCEYLIKNKFESVKNLIGGINEWAKKIDPSLTIY